MPNAITPPVDPHASHTKIMRAVMKEHGKIMLKTPMRSPTKLGSVRPNMLALRQTYDEWKADKGSQEQVVRVQDGKGIKR